MEENKEMLELLKQIEKNSRRQARTGSLLCLLVVVLVLCCAGLCGAILLLLPQVETVIAQMQSVLHNLEQTTAQLAAADLGSMVSNVDTLVATGQYSLEQTMEKLNSLDLDTLNQAIQNLADVVEPLARVTNMFK